jgi:DNA/RNA-binding domain of Phe-tRNA-synthetase-like protein
MKFYQAADSWKTTYPGASVGFLAMQELRNPQENKELELRKQALETQLRARYAGQERSTLADLPVIQAYRAYLKPFKKSYHVQQQLESLIYKGKAIPSRAALVEAMFMTELESGLLTAGHDLDSVKLPLRVEASLGGEHYLGLSGQEKVLKAGDMYIADQEGIISSIVYGPDSRTQLNPATQNAVFTVYAPPGIEFEAVSAHLENLRDHLWLFSPQAEVILLEVCR